MSVSLRVCNKCLLPSLCSIDLDWRNHRLPFRDPVRDDDRFVSIEEVEHSVLDAVGLRPELVDAIAEIVGSRTAKAMPLLRQKAEAALDTEFWP